MMRAKKVHVEKRYVSVQEHFRTAYGTLCATYERQSVEPSICSCVVIAMPSQRKTASWRRESKRPRSKVRAFSFFTPQQLRQLGDSRPVSSATAGNAVRSPQTEAPCLSQCPSNST